MQSHDVGMGVGEHVTEDSKHTTPIHNHPYISTLAGSGVRLDLRDYISCRDHHPPQEVLPATCLQPLSVRDSTLACMLAFSGLGLG